MDPGLTLGAKHGYSIAVYLAPRGVAADGRLPNATMRWDIPGLRVFFTKNGDSKSPGLKPVLAAAPGTPQFWSERPSWKSRVGVLDHSSPVRDQVVTASVH